MNAFKKTFAALLGFAALSVAVYAADHDWNHPLDEPTQGFNVWVSTRGIGKVPMKVVQDSSETMNVSNYGSEMSKAFCVLASPKKFEPNKWSEYSFSFTPRKDGEVTIWFDIRSTQYRHPEYSKLRTSFAAFMRIANVRAKGASIADGTFSGKDAMKIWTDGVKHDFSKIDIRLAPTIGKDPDAPGGRYLRFCHTYRLGTPDGKERGYAVQPIKQTISVRKGREVTISFSAQPDVQFAPVN